MYRMFKEILNCHTSWLDCLISNLNIGVQLWRCHCSQFALLWDTYDYKRHEEPNRAFRGIERISPITDKKEIYFPTYQRLLRYLFSFAVTMGMVGLAIIAMTISLNLNGYVTDKKSPLYISYLASFAAPVSWNLSHIHLAVSDWD